MFDKFFDCLNVRSPDEHKRRRKPDLKPYTSASDERLHVSRIIIIMKLLNIIIVTC